MTGVWRGAWLGLLLLSARPAAADGERLVLIGGGERPPEAMARFVEWAGGPRARLLVVPWATQEPEESEGALRRELAVHRPGRIVAAAAAPLSAGQRDAFLDELRQATGVFFTGGDQNRILDVLRDAGLKEALRRRYGAGVAFGGTSAGTAVMSSLALTGEGDLDVVDGDRVGVRAGLGLLPGVILDQHFLARQRQNRLLGLVLKHPRLLGLGLDEGAGLLVRDDRHAEVVGRGRVMTLESRGKGELRVFLLSAGDGFDLEKRKPEKPRRRP
jgi:cyanophycinase